MENEGKQNIILLLETFISLIFYYLFILALRIVGVTVLQNVKIKSEMCDYEVIPGLTCSQIICNVGPCIA